MTAGITWPQLKELCHVELPLAESGLWKIEKKTITEKAGKQGRMMSLFSGHGRYTPAGTYTGLLYNGSVIMSDVPDEIRDVAAPIWKAHEVGGSILVTGLGLGMERPVCSVVPVCA